MSITFEVLLNPRGTIEEMEIQNVVGDNMSQIKWAINHGLLGIHLPRDGLHVVVRWLARFNDLHKIIFAVVYSPARPALLCRLLI